MLHGALHSVARGEAGAHLLDQAILTDDQALQPVLRWIKGISHFLADSCAKSLPLLQFPGGNEILRPLCQADGWEAHILAEVVAGWAQFGPRCDGPKAGAAKSLQEHRGLQGLCRPAFTRYTSFTQGPYQTALRELHIFLPMRMAMLGLLPFKDLHGSATDTRSFACGANAQQVVKVTSSVYLDLKPTPTRTAPALSMAVNGELIPGKQCGAPRPPGGEARPRGGGPPRGGGDGAPAGGGVGGGR